MTAHWFHLVRVRRALVALLAAIGLGAYALVVAEPAAAATLLSQGKTATASSAQAGNAAAAAVDGDTGTRWESAWADPQWIQVDLGAPASIGQVVLQWETASAKSYQLQVSTDAATWTTVYSTTTGAGGTESLTVNGTGRYVRLTGTARNTGYGYSLWEFQVYGTTGSGSASCGTTDAALNRPATASSAENAGTPASAAFDGDTGTRWSSAASDPQWLQVDLGAVQTLCRASLMWEAAYATAFQLQVSTDGATWTPVYSTTTGTGGTQTLDVSGTGRYVRMYGTARATGYGYSLWSLQVYTTSAAWVLGPGDLVVRAGAGVFVRGRQRSGRGTGRPDHDALGKPGQRSTVDRDRPRRHGHGQLRGAELGKRLRVGLHHRRLPRRPDVDHRFLHHQRQRRRGDAEPLR